MSTRVPQERRRRRPTRSGVLLSESLIVETALRLIGEHGPEALSVRRLGAALGCDPTALYRYFQGTDDLVLAVADRIIGDAMAGFVPGDDWVASLREMALRVRAGYLAHPRAAALASYRVTRRGNEIRAVETGIGLLLSAGFEPARAARLYLAFIDTVLSHAATDAAFHALPPQRREADRRAWRDVYQKLDPVAFPALTAVRPELPGMADSSFEEAVDLLLEALAARAPTTTGTRPRSAGPRSGTPLSPPGALLSPPAGPRTGTPLTPPGTRLNPPAEPPPKAPPRTPVVP